MRWRWHTCLRARALRVVDFKLRERRGSGKLEARLLQDVSIISDHWAGEVGLH